MSAVAASYPNDARSDLDRGPVPAGRKRRLFRTKVRPLVFVGDAIRVPLTNGLFATVDLADRSIVEGHNWAVLTDGKGFTYASRGTKRPEPKALILLQRAVVGAGPGWKVEFIDGNRLNCRSANLRAIPPAPPAVPFVRPIRPVEIIGDSVKITLSKGYCAWVDLADIDIVAPHNWSARLVRDSDLVYAVRHCDGKQVFLHRCLMTPPPGFQVDHRDHDGLNCRRSNMRLATFKQNRWNQRRCRRNTSGATGAYLDRRDGRYFAVMAVDGVKHRLGKFDTAEEAGAAYAAAAEALHGDFAFTRSGSASSTISGGVE